MTLPLELRTQNYAHAIPDQLQVVIYGRLPPDTTSMFWSEISQYYDYESTQNPTGSLLLVNKKVKAEVTASYSKPALVVVQWETGSDLGRWLEYPSSQRYMKHFGGVAIKMYYATIEGTYESDAEVERLRQGLVGGLTEMVASKLKFLRQTGVYWEKKADEPEFERYVVEYAVIEEPAVGTLRLRFAV